MGAERGLEGLGKAQGLEGRRGFEVGKGHCAELNETQAHRNEERQPVQPAFVFEMSVRHGGYCNLFGLRRMPNSSGFKKRGDLEK